MNMNMKEMFVNRLIQKKFSLGVYTNDAMLFTGGNREIIIVHDDYVVFCKYQNKTTRIQFEDFSWDPLTDTIYKGTSRSGWKIGSGEYHWGQTYTTKETE